MQDAKAYIDPSTTSYIIQIIAAGFITLGVVFSMFTARAKLFFIKIKMKILTERYSALPQQNEPESKRNIGPLAALFMDDRPAKVRFMLALIPSFAIMFTFVIFGSYDLAIANRATLPFTLKDIWLVLLLTGLAGCTIMTFLLCLLKGKVFDIFLSISVGALLAGYLQGNFFNLDFGQLTGDSIDWPAYRVHSIINTLVWVLLVSLPSIVHYFSKVLWRGLCIALPVLLVTIQLVSLLVSFATTDVLRYRGNEKYLATTGMYEMSEKDNIIVFLLDRLDEAYIQTVLKENPHYFDDLDGFTRYTDNITAYCRTYPAVVQMFTGEVTLLNEPRTAYFNRAYGKPNFLRELQNENYTTKLYMGKNYTYSYIEQIEDFADNIEKGTAKVLWAPALKSFLTLSAYKYCPYAFKATFWTDTWEFISSTGRLEAEFPYVSNDPGFYQGLLTNGITLQAEKDNFTYYHFSGLHTPYVMNENAELAATGETSELQQLKGCFHIIREVIREMKQLGIYENASIIITGDHGYSGSDARPLDRAVLTSLFVKPKGQAGTPLSVSNAPVSSDNFRGTMMKMAGLEDPAYPEAYWEVPEDSAQSRSYFFQVSHDSNHGVLEEFAVHAPGHSFENWEKITEYPFVVTE